jgi:hypothetical protein
MKFLAISTSWLGSYANKFTYISRSSAKEIVWNGYEHSQKWEVNFSTSFASLHFKFSSDIMKLTGDLKSSNPRFFPCKLHEQSHSASYH